MSEHTLSTHAQLLYRLDRIDEALLALSQMQMLILEMLTKQPRAILSQESGEEENFQREIELLSEQFGEAFPNFGAWYLSSWSEHGRRSVGG